MQTDYLLNTAFHGLALLLALISYIVLACVVLHQKTQIDNLTDRLMARDYREYQTIQKPEPKTQTKEERPQRARDDVLGGTY